MISYSVPISVKGIVFDKGRVWLRKNERNEWELPGGKLDSGEQPEQTAIREMQEELGFATEVVDIVQSYLYTIKSSNDESRGVLVVSYLCKLLSKTGEFEIDGEGGKAQFQDFSVDEISKLNMSEFYKIGIQKAWKIFSSQP